MPPKAKPKKDDKKMQKVIEDKTFGLKNKKGAKMQKYIAQLQNQVKGNQKQGPNQGAKKKKDEDDDLMDINKIFKPVQAMPKIGQDVDPKSVLCVFFKQGMCQKGNKCKFSHDLSVQQKTAKRNLYFDSRDAKKDAENQETSENWDEKQLAEAAEKKHGEKDRKRPNQTDIVCKYFIEAVENSQYGWFWECPNGDTCIYRHALPPGYVLKKDRKRIDELNKMDEISLEELIEKERSALSSAKCTKVTLETFIAWKKRKLREKQKEKQAEEKRKQTNFRSGKQLGLSGRELFTFNPDFVGEDDEDATDDKYEREPVDGDEDNDEARVKAFEIDENTFFTLEDGKRLDDFDDLEDEDEKSAAETSANNKPVMFDENLFNAGDADELPDDDEDDTDADEDTGGSGADDLAGYSGGGGPPPGFPEKPSPSGQQKPPDITDGNALEKRLKL